MFTSCLIGTLEKDEGFSPLAVTGYSASLLCLVWPAGRTRLPDYGPQRKEIYSTEICVPPIKKGLARWSLTCPGTQEQSKHKETCRDGLGSVCVCMCVCMCMCMCLCLCTCMHIPVLIPRVRQGTRQAGGQSSSSPEVLIYTTSVPREA